jgi:hypothetical protein
MNPAQALLEAQLTGISVELDGLDLLLSARSRPAARLIAALSMHKAEIASMLRDHRLTAKELFDLFDERAAMIEYEGQQPREVAEMQAIGCCVLSHMMSQGHDDQLVTFIRALPDYLARCRSLEATARNINAEPEK